MIDLLLLLTVVALVCVLVLIVSDVMIKIVMLMTGSDD